MDYMQRALDAIKNLVRQLIELLAGPEVEAELEVIPIPVRDRNYR